MAGTPKDPGPQPTEGLGIADLIAGRIVDLKPGHDKSSPSAIAEGQGVLPPSNPNAAPTTSLAERLRQSLKDKEGQK